MATLQTAKRPLSLVFLDRTKVSRGLGRAGERSSGPPPQASPSSSSRSHRTDLTIVQKYDDQESVPAESNDRCQYDRRNPSVYGVHGHVQS